MGDGDTGDRKGATGDLSDKDGREAGAAFVEMLRDSLGFKLRVASILAAMIEMGWCCGGRDDVCWTRGCTACLAACTL